MRVCRNSLVQYTPGSRIFTILRSFRYSPRSCWAITTRFRLNISISSCHRFALMPRDCFSLGPRHDRGVTTDTSRFPQLSPPAHEKPATPSPARRETGDAKPFQPRRDDVAQRPCYRARIDFARQHASRHRSNALAARCHARPHTRCGTSTLVLLNYSSASRRGRRSFIVGVTYTQRSFGSWSRNRTCDRPIISRLLFPLSYPLALKTHLRSVHTVRSR